MPWYLDELLRSSSAVNKRAPVPAPRSAMCWVSTTGKSTCLGAPWAHTPDFSTMSKMIREEITSCNLPAPCLLLNPCPPPSPACAIPSRTWHISQTSHGVSLERENADLGWSALCLHKICPYLLIQVVEEICDQQSMNKMRSSYMSNVFLRVRKGKRQKTSPWMWCLWQCQTGPMLTTSLQHRRQPLNKH